MPFYDITRSTSTNGTTLTSTTHLWGTTVANQETVSIMGAFASARASSAGGATMNLQFNTGTVASGGTTTTPAAKNARSAPAAQSSWKNDATAITPGTTLVTREAIGFAQTGGMGGYVPIVPGAALQMMPNATNPVDFEITTLAVGTSIPFTLSVDFMEGTS